MASFWKQVLLNRSDRPILGDDEVSLFVHDDTGLYQGKLKILDRQNGRVYITNRRLIYVDNLIKLKSVAIEIDTMVRLEAIDGFLRSSPKVKVYLTTSDDLSKSANGTPPPTESVPQKLWICMICTFNNAASSTLCASCGVKRRELITAVPPEPTNCPSSNDAPPHPSTLPVVPGLCPHCTFQNHASMRYCEICGSKLVDMDSADSVSRSSTPSGNDKVISLRLEDSQSAMSHYIKVSFHKGGSTKFFEILGQQIEQMKWEALVSKGKINQNGRKINDESNKVHKPSIDHTLKQLGIHGLEQIGEHQRKLNELVLSTSLEDLEQLMYKAQDLIKMSSSFSKLIKPVTNQYGQLNNSTALILQLKTSKSSKLYHRELSRHLSEFLLNFELKKPWNMITTQDLFAHYNRYLSSTQGYGTDLVFATDILQATDLFELLNLPFHRHKYERSGIVVIKPRTETDNQSMIHRYLIKEEGSTGKTLGQISDHFEWSYVVAEEEVDRCIRESLVVVDENISGIFYFLNWFAQEEKGKIGDDKK